MEDHLGLLLISLTITVEARATRTSDIATKGITSLQQRLLNASVGAGNLLGGGILDIV